MSRFDWVKNALHRGARPDRRNDLPVVPEHPEEIVEAPDPADADALRNAAANQGGAIATFLWYHPFVGFFCYLARIHYPEEQTTNVLRFRRENKKLYNIFVFLDFVLMVLAIVFTLWIALKALWPLPFVS